MVRTGRQLGARVRDAGQNVGSSRVRVDVRKIRAGSCGVVRVPGTEKHLHVELGRDDIRVAVKPGIQVRSY